MPHTFRQRLNGWIGKMLLRRGFRVERDYRFPQSNLNLLQLAAQAFAARMGDLPQVVQIGAYDGKTTDPVSSLLEQGGYRALIVEPQDVPFAALRECYAGFQNVILDQVLVAAMDGVAELHLPAGVSHSQLGCTDKAHLMKMGFDESRIVTVRVNALTPASLLAKHAVKRVDILQIDAEGADFQILKLFLDAGFCPSVINIETFHLSATDRSALRQRMESLNYQFVDHGLDTLFVHRQVFQHV